MNYDKIIALYQRRLDSLLGESGRMSRPIKLRHFPHARMKLVSTKIYIPFINIDFFRIFMNFFLEISLYATFRTVNHPLERFLESKRHFPVYFDLSLRPCNLMPFQLTIFEDKNLKFPWFDFTIFFKIS